MSGGSMNYLYTRVQDVADLLSASSDLHRRAFGQHLNLVAKALHDIEWVDSADCGPGDEIDAIEACVSPRDRLDVGIQIAEAALEGLRKQLANIKAKTGSAS